MKKRNPVRCALILIASGLALTLIALCLLKFDFTKFSTEETEIDVITLEDAFDSINVRASDSDVTVLVSADGVCRVSIPKGKNIVSEAAVRDGVLNVSATDTAPWYVLRMRFGKQDGIRVELPKDAYAALDVQTGSGNVSVASDLTFETVDIRMSSGNLDFRAEAGTLNTTVTSGNILLNDVAAEEIAMQTTSGNLTLEGCEAGSLNLTAVSGEIRGTLLSTRTFDAQTTSGDLRLNGLTCANLKIQATSGSCNLADVFASDTMEAELSSGNLTLERCDAGSLNLTTTSGAIRGTLLSPKMFDAQATSGQISVPADADGGQCVIKTGSGDIRIRISE